MSNTSQAQPKSETHHAFYRAVWRWHFYAGLFVIPFLIMLALTGGFMMVYSDIGNELGMAPNVAVSGTVKPVSQQAKAALATVPDGKLVTYVAPRATDQPAYFEVTKAGATISVAVDPYTTTVLNVIDEASTYRALAEKIHGTLLIGTVGDLLIEAAASLTIVLILSGLYMWWPRDRSFAQALVPRFSAQGRGLWKELHMTTGFWISAVLILFMLSGLAWSGIWGERYVQPWSSFPSNKWDNVPISDLTHASLNHDIFHEVPWALEKTPMPASGSTAGSTGVEQPVALDSVAMWAANHGFSGQYKLAVPTAEKGVYTVSYDGRNQDSAVPSNDRFVHIDQYTGNILADVDYAQYKPVGKIMAWGMALHKGMVGRVNFVFNLIYLVLVLFVCVSGTVMWWKRRPAGTLAAPLYPSAYKIPAFIIAVAMAIAILFPMAGASIVVFAIIDFLMPKHLKQASFQKT